jgi:hypothetical protein
MNILKYFCTACIMLCSLTIAAQQPETVPSATVKDKFEAGFDGMLAASYGSKALGINVGGPSLKYKFTKNFKIGVGAFPSLFVMDDKAVPRLAVSPIIEYRKWMLITPYYGYDSKNKQIWTFGVGYKFF